MKSQRLRSDRLRPSREMFFCMGLRNFMSFIQKFWVAVKSIIYKYYIYKYIVNVVGKLSCLIICDYINEMHAKSSPPSLSPTSSPPPLSLHILYMFAVAIPHCNVAPLQLFKMVPERQTEKRTCHRCISMHWSNIIIFICFLAFGHVWSTQFTQIKGSNSPYGVGWRKGKLSRTDILPSHASPST